MTWEEMMWQELNAQPPIDQFAASGEWITRMTQVLLPALGRRRRDLVVGLLEDPDWDAGRLADATGARRTTIVRLAEEGRAARRAEQGRGSQ
jgi:hypothetical protein